MNNKHPSAKTSVNQIPAAFKHKIIASILEGGTNLDFGGGRFDTATEYLREELDCDNQVYDPYNRTKAHNAKVLSDFCYTSITCLNVLNVITTSEGRINLLKEIHKVAFEDPGIQDIMFQVYEGDKSGIAKGTQANLKPKEYIEEITSVFSWTSWELKVLGSKRNIFLLKYVR